MRDRSSNDISYSHYPAGNESTAQSGFTYYGDNYTIYGSNRNSDISLCTLGTQQFRISTTINITDTVSQHVMASCFESNRKGFLVFVTASVLYIIMYANTDTVQYSGPISTGVDYNIVITRDGGYNVTVTTSSGTNVALTYTGPASP